MSTGEMFTDNEQQYLQSHRLGRMATQQPDGMLQVNPVGYRFNPAVQSVDVVGYRMEHSRKFHNVDANGRVAFVVDDVTEHGPRFVEIRGWGEIVTAPATGAAARTPFAVDARFIRIHPERVISWNIEPPGPDDPPMHPVGRDAVPREKWHR